MFATESHGNNVHAPAARDISSSALEAVLFNTESLSVIVPAFLIH